VVPDATGSGANATVWISDWLAELKLDADAKLRE